jgi:hypothetical protein
MLNSKYFNSRRQYQLSSILNLLLKPLESFNKINQSASSLNYLEVYKIYSSHKLITFDVSYLVIYLSFFRQNLSLLH